MDQAVKTTSAKRKAPSKVSPYLGTTRDGVRIVRPKFKATHFTDAQLKAAVRAVKAASAKQEITTAPLPAKG
jgi:hypothetical protein